MCTIPNKKIWNLLAVGTFLNKHQDPVVCVPCTYFIGENGMPLEVTGGHVEPQQFAEKIDSVIQVSDEIARRK